MNPMNNEITMYLGLQSIKNYWRRAAQVANELSYF